ncbi:DNA-methyltransferase [Enterococcus gallinarum]|uniref:DNA-methyltransferase n=1 Tax=Enterococcus gallinarum TaxID=1353 RepID=UPI001F03334D|nr:site-specific DNA-methyltransferase [Enterococcus gallinarum]
MNKIDLLQGDCLELMKDIPDKSVDLILTDPPYNIGKAKWDKISNYIEWCGKWFIECQRVLKDNGSFYWWQNDMVQIAQLMEWLRNNSEFVFNSFIIWDKGDFRSLSWKNPGKGNKLRSWFNVCEYCLSYTLQDAYGLNHYLMQEEKLLPVQKYLLEERRKTGLSNSEIRELLGQNTVHYFSLKASHWRMPSQENYKILQSTGFFDRDYQSLFSEYIEIKETGRKGRYTHNLDTNHNNVWRSCERNNGKQHPTQKPNDLMERIIKTSSNQGDTVLDLFMGSGSTGVACKNLNRKFIGMELDETYFNIAKERIENHR